ncbi:MAG: sigma 54-interacting transcriptional regulator [Verrucomicrobiales bacterium]|nr:sigma 54-interacting transcriptional regulator [Verrucomicrobiales bacterium]
MSPPPPPIVPAVHRPSSAGHDTGATASPPAAGIAHSGIQLPGLNEEAALRLVVEGTVAETGVEFFRALVRNLAMAMNTAGAWVTEYFPAGKRLRAHAFWLNGEFIEGFEYPIAGTACEPVIEEKRLVHIPDRLLEIFPHDDGDLDERLRPAVSYLGVPLLTSQGEVMGHLSVLDTRPMTPPSRLVSLFEIFAARAAAEQRRLREEERVRAREEELSALLDSAMDAVIVVDGNEQIARINPAGERFLGADRLSLVGMTVWDFLPDYSRPQFVSFLREVDAQPPGQGQLWIPRSLTIRRRDGATFEAEATISRFMRRGSPFRTLILRNVSDRLAAERRLELLSAETEYLRDSAREGTGLGAILGRSRVMQDLFDALQRVAATDTTVLITGETGTGKELVARSLHEASPRHERPLVRVNCAAIPGTLMESEFFGHERGAFTGANTRREGRFALADGGTLFLDEVGELPLDLQAKLLRVLQEGEFEPLGSTRTRKVDVRVAAATNRDLAAMVRDGKFREDLFYRLNVFPLRVPPLRERGNDVALLARDFLERLGRRMGRRLDPLHPDQVRLLLDYAWPGNVRELQNVIERAIILSPGPRLELDRAMPALAPKPPAIVANEGPSLLLTAVDMTAIERQNVERALAEAGGRIAGAHGAARRLGLAPSTLSSRMKTLGIVRPARS